MVVKYDEGTTTEAEVAKRHRRIDCQAGDKAKVDARRSQRCPVKKCKNKLTSTSTFTCKNCGLKFCMEHRFEDDHNCVKPTTHAKHCSQQALKEYLQKERLVAHNAKTMIY